MSTTTIRCFVTLTNGSDIVALTAGNAGNNGISLAAPNVIEDMQLVANNPINATRFIKGSLSTTTLQLQEAWSGATLANVEVRISTSGAAVANLTQAVRDLINTKAAEGTALTTAVTQAQSSADAAAASAGSIGTQLDNLDIKVQQATDAATAAGGSAGTAATKAGEAGASAEAAATHVAAIGAYAQTALDEAAISLTAAAEAKTARDLAVAAWAASTAPAETLAAMSQFLHFGAIVDICIDEPWRHSDGGAWTDRCQDKSWYTEALGGDRWIGQRATIAAAWTAAGSAVGAVFQATTTAGPCTAGRFYQATSNTTATEVFRGINRAYQKSGIVWIAESLRVIGYELATGAMWMVFVAANGRAVNSNAGAAVSSLAAFNGDLLVGVSGSTGSLGSINLLKDYCKLIATTNTEYNGAKVVNRNVASVDFISGGAQVAIVSRNVNDVAITVSTGAPIDPATGLPVPTIYVGTAGGLSTILDTGAVVHDTSTNASNASVTKLALAKNGFVVRNWSDGHRYGVAKIAAPTGVGDYSLYSSSAAAQAVPQLPLAGSSYAIIERDAIGTAYGLTRLRENPSDRTKTMVAAITNAYNTGWMPGDIRGAWLANTVAETVTESGELVTGDSKDFAGGTAGDWASASAVASTASVVSQELQVTATVTSGRQVLPITTTIGRSYVITVSARRISGAGLVSAGPCSSTGSSLTSGPTTTSGTAVTLPSSFTATASTSYIYMGAGAAGDVAGFDNISVKLADPDRSIKNKGGVIVGSLTKTAVATGAQLVAYSGWGTGNYIDFYYDAGLDFGMAPFAFHTPIKEASNSANEVIVERAYYTAGAYSGARFRLEVLAAGNLKATFSDGTNTATLTSSGVIDDSTWHIGVIFGFDGVNFRLIDAGGLDMATPVARGAVGSLTNTNAIARIGLGVNGADPLTSGSLCLLRPTTTHGSADQIAQIYRDELPLFQPGAQCTIAGTSTAVTAMASDESTDLLRVGTSWGRTSFKGLARVDSETTTVGAITSLAARGGIVLTGGTNATIYQPALKLRDELRRREIAAKALGQTPVFFEFDTASFNSPTTSGSAALTASSIFGTPYVGMGITGTGIPAGTTLLAISGTVYTMSAAATVTNAGAVAIGQSSFTLQQGYTAKAVYSAESLKREGTTKTYTRANDGYRETINFAVSPGGATWVSVMAVRA